MALKLAHSAARSAETPVQERRRALRRGKESRPDDHEPAAMIEAAATEAAERGAAESEVAESEAAESEAAGGDGRTTDPTEMTAVETGQGHDGPARAALFGMELEAPPVDPAQDASAPPTLAIGNIDAFDFSQILGWAWHAGEPDESVDVEVLVDNVVILKVAADRFRPDLLSARAGNGRHGFLVDDVQHHLSPGNHSVCLRRAKDGQELPGSPLSIVGSQPGPELGGQLRPGAIEAGAVALQPVPPAPIEALAIGNIDRVDYDEISGWAWDSSSPDEAIDIEILDDSVVVLKLTADQFRADLVGIGGGHGRHGFSVRNLVGVFPLSRHRVRVRRASDGRDLPESPVWISQPGLDFRAVDFIDQVVTTAIQAATKPDDLAQPLGQVLRLAGDLVNARDDLARTQKTPPRTSLAEIAAGQLAGQARDLAEHIRHAFAPLYFDTSDQPEVSVIIPVHNKFSYTYDCLKSIHLAMPRRSFEIIIADDCSDDETLLCCLILSGAVQVARNQKNVGFVRTCNAGAAMAKGKYLLFLNNDTLVKPGWLDELVETFEQVPNVGIAGSKLLFEDGKLQEAGGIVWRLGDGWNWGRGRDAAEPAFSYLRDADWVSGAALMIEGSMFRDLNGFDDILAPGYYEDTDLAFRVRALGKRVVMQPASQIVHLEGISSGTDVTGPGMKRYQVINHAKFYQRWKDTLLTHRFNGQQPELEAERRVVRRAYFIDDTVPTPDQDAGSNAAVEHMRALMAMGYKVTFLPADNMSKIDPYTAQLQKIGIECLYHPWFWSVEEVFRKTVNKPDLVYLHRHTNASKYATMVRGYFPDCRIVYSVADLHFLRMERQAAVEPGTISAAAMASQRHSEMAAMLSVDAVIVHSPIEAKLLHETEPSLKIKVVPWTVHAKPTLVPFRERSGIAFVGGFGHPPNLDAARHLVEDIVPLLRQPLPDMLTYLIGSKMPQEMTSIRVPGVVAVGHVPVLADVLHKLRLTVVSLRYGAGIKGKVLESFAHGLPCVMSEVAAEGLELPDDLAWLVAGSVAAFAEKIVRVHEDASFNRELAEAGLAYIARRCGAGVVAEGLRAAVGW